MRFRSNFKTSKPPCTKATSGKGSKKVTDTIRIKQNPKKKALVVTSRNNHYPIIRPVVEELLGREWRVTILRFERIWEKVETILSRTTKKRSLRSFYVKATRRPSKKIGVRVRWYAFKLIAKFISFLMNAFKLEKPNIILVLTDSVLPCKIAVLVGKFANIPSLLLLQSGVIGRNYECPSFHVDKIAVTGEFAGDLLIKCGVNKDKLVVTGQTTYDALVRAEEHLNKDNICKQLGLDPEKKIVVFTTQPLPPRENEAQVYAICEAMKQFSDLQFVVKVHPAELNFSMYERIAKNVGVNALITRDANIYEVLYACDILITSFSTTALDAMILDKPVITVNFTGLVDPIPYAEKGAAIGVYEEKDLVEAIKRGLYDENTREKLRESREKFIYEYCYKMDGKATERVVELVELMST